MGSKSKSPYSDLDEAIRVGKKVGNAIENTVIAAAIAYGLFTYFYYHVIRLLYHFFRIVKWVGPIIIFLFYLLVENPTQNIKEFLLYLASAWWLLGLLFAYLLNRHSYNMVLNGIRELKDEYDFDLENENDPLVIKALNELKEKGEL